MKTLLAVLLAALSPMAGFAQGVSARATNTALYSSDGSRALTITNASMYLFGSGSVGAGIDPSVTSLFGVGDTLLFSATLDNSCADLFGFGDQPFRSLNGTGSVDIYGFGDEPLGVVTMNSSADIYGLGDGPFVFANIANSTDMYAWGFDTCQSAILASDARCFGYGYKTLLSGILDHCSDIYAYGSFCLAGSQFTNGARIYAIGDHTGTNLSGVFTDLMLIGSGATATASFQWVAGDARYQYFFPGTNGMGVKGVVSGTNGFASYKNNKSAPTTISVTASPFNYTNSQSVNIQVFLDANGATTAVTMNGTSIFSSLVGGDHGIILQPGDWITTTYSIATPTMKYREF